MRLCGGRLNVDRPNINIGVGKITNWLMGWIPIGLIMITGIICRS